MFCNSLLQLNITKRRKGFSALGLETEEETKLTKTKFTLT